MNVVESKIAFYEKDIDNPYSVNGFKGTWQFSSHNTIPEVLHGLLQRYFGVYRIRRIPIGKINAFMNEIWDGPGSLKKVFEFEEELRKSGREVKFSAADVAAMKSKVEDDEDDADLSRFPDLPLPFSNDDDEEI